MKIIDKKEALAKGFSKYFTGKPCKQGHTSERYVTSRACVDCTMKRRLESYAKNTEKCNKQSREWYLKNSDKHKEKSKIWQKTNSEKVKIINRTWLVNNRDIANARTNKRRAYKIQRTPLWADHNEILKFYSESARLTKETGIQYHVDHIVPLQGELVSGLHVHYNLQVITAAENCRKNNTFIPN